MEQSAPSSVLRTIFESFKSLLKKYLFRLAFDICNVFNLLCNIFSVYLYFILGLFTFSLDYYAHFNIYSISCYTLLIIFAWKERIINF